MFAKIEVVGWMSEVDEDILEEEEACETQQLWNDFAKICRSAKPLSVTTSREFDLLMILGQSRWP